MCFNCSASRAIIPVIIFSSQRPQEMARLGFASDAMDYVVPADPTITSLTNAGEAGDEPDALRA